MTSLPAYLIEFKSKVERRLGTVIDFVEDCEGSVNDKAK